jgi:hypothetical protein
VGERGKGRCSLALPPLEDQYSLCGAKRITIIYYSLNKVKKAGKAEVL